MSSEYEVNAEKNIRLYEQIELFAPEEMKPFLLELTLLEKRLVTLFHELQLRRTPSIPNTHSLRSTFIRLFKEYLAIVKDKFPEKYTEVSNTFVEYYTYLKLDRDTKSEIAKAYNQGKNAEVSIYTYFSHLLEIHDVVVSSLKIEYKHCQSKFMKGFVDNSVSGFDMLPKKFTPSTESKTSDSSSGTIKIPL